MQPIEQVTGTGVPLLLDDIDTDRIIPARYLKCVTFEGLGDHAFEDDRKQDPDHPFDDARFADAGILVAGRNFGCGSSREHAPQSLMRWGIKAVVAESFAEIFFGNCTSLGIPAIAAPRADLEKLAAAVEAWMALFADGNFRKGRIGVIDQIESWLMSNTDDLSPTARGYIATVVNPKKTKGGGAPTTSVK